MFNNKFMHIRVSTGSNNNLNVAQTKVDIYVNMI